MASTAEENGDRSEEAHISLTQTYMLLRAADISLTESYLLLKEAYVV